MHHRHRPPWVLALLFAALSALFVSACGSPPEVDTGQGVSVAPDHPVALVGAKDLATDADANVSEGDGDDEYAYAATTTVKPEPAVPTPLEPRAVSSDCEPDYSTLTQEAVMQGDAKQATRTVSYVFGDPDYQSAGGETEAVPRSGWL